MPMGKNLEGKQNGDSSRITEKLKRPIMVDYTYQFDWPWVVCEGVSG